MCSSNFSGKLSELKLHLVSCRSGDIHCAKCNRPVAREAVAEHYRKCCKTNFTLQSATDARVREAVEEIRGIKEDLESLRQEGLNVHYSENELVNGLVDRLANLDRSLSVAQEKSLTPTEKAISHRSHLHRALYALRRSPAGTSILVSCSRMCTPHMINS
ncbi:hypothetical protein MRX96_053535 [Rhipicephalus microplus]